MMIWKQITVAKMKNYHKLFFLFFVSMPIMAYSQKHIENANLRASYEFYYKTSLEQTEFTNTDLMYLDIGEKNSKFYSRYQQVRDSIGDKGLEKGLSAFEINEIRRGYPRGTTTIYYNFLEEQKRSITTNFSYLFAYYDEDRRLPKWQIENQTKEISGYKCQKATTHYLGRDWIAYFTPEIPISQGPWKLWGLPGLIIEATDKNNFFKFTLIGFEELQSRTPIIFIHKTSDGKDYEKNDKQSFRKMEKMYYTNNNEFMMFFLGVKLISSTRADGTKIERNSRPYIPLEPW